MTAALVIAVALSSVAVCCKLTELLHVLQQIRQNLLGLRDEVAHIDVRLHGVEAPERRGR